MKYLNWHKIWISFALKNITGEYYASYEKKCEYYNSYGKFDEFKMNTIVPLGNSWILLFVWAKIFPHNCYIRIVLSLVPSEFLVILVF